VLAYRLIARGTIEEKIMELQQRKKSLLGSLVLADEGVAKKMDWEDIRFLLDIK
jgi:non-specific serine/threonine protein kinase